MQESGGKPSKNDDSGTILPSNPRQMSQQQPDSENVNPSNGSLGTQSGNLEPLRLSPGMPSLTSWSGKSSPPGYSRTGQDPRSLRRHESHLGFDTIEDYGEAEEDGDESRESLEDGQRLGSIRTEHDIDQAYESARGPSCTREMARVMSRWLPHAPLFKKLKTYSLQKTLRDAHTAITALVIMAPQCIAYASMAGLPPEYGLYGALVPGLVYTLFGECPASAIGPYPTVSLALIDAIIIVHPDYASLSLTDPAQSSRIAVRISLAVALVSGVIIVLLALFHMGWAISFFSEPSLHSYTCACAYLLISSQLANLLQVQVKPVVTIQGVWSQIIHKITTTNIPSLIIGLVSLAVLIGAGMFAARIGASVLFASTFIVCAASIIITWQFNMEDEYKVRTIGSLSSALPPVGIPTFPPFGPLFEASLPVMAVSVMVSATVATTMANRGGYFININQELFALGTSMLAGSFFGAMPGSSSQARANVLAECNPSSTAWGLILFPLLFLTIAFLHPVLRYLPYATLASIVLYTFKRALIGVAAPFTLWKTARKEAIGWVITFFVTLFLGTIYGLVAALGVSIACLFYGIARPEDAVLGKLPNCSTFRDVENYPKAKQYPGILIYRFDCSVVFVNHLYFHRRLTQEIKRKLKEIREAQEKETEDRLAKKVLRHLKSNERAEGAASLIRDAEKGIGMEDITPTGGIDSIGRRSLTYSAEKDGWRVKRLTERPTPQSNSTPVAGGITRPRSNSDRSAAYEYEAKMERSRGRDEADVEGGQPREEKTATDGVRQDRKEDGVGGVGGVGGIGGIGEKKTSHVSFQLERQASMTSSVGGSPQAGRHRRARSFTGGLTEKERRKIAQGELAFESEQAAIELELARPTSITGLFEGLQGQTDTRSKPRKGIKWPQVLQWGSCWKRKREGVEGEGKSRTDEGKSEIPSGSTGGVGIVPGLGTRQMLSRPTQSLGADGQREGRTSGGGAMTDDDQMRRPHHMPMPMTPPQRRRSISPERVNATPGGGRVPGRYRNPEPATPLWPESEWSRRASEGLRHRRTGRRMTNSDEGSSGEYILGGGGGGSSSGGGVGSDKEEAEGGEGTIEMTQFRLDDRHPRTTSQISNSLRRTRSQDVDGRRLSERHGYTDGGPYGMRRQKVVRRQDSFAQSMRNLWGSAIDTATDAAAVLAKRWQTEIPEALELVVILQSAGINGMDETSLGMLAKMMARKDVLFIFSECTEELRHVLRRSSLLPNISKLMFPSLVEAVVFARACHRISSHRRVHANSALSRELSASSILEDTTPRPSNSSISSSVYPSSSNLPSFRSSTFLSSPSFHPTIPSSLSSQYLPPSSSQQDNVSYLDQGENIQRSPEASGMPHHLRSSSLPPRVHRVSESSSSSFPSSSSSAIGQPTETPPLPPKGGSKSGNLLPSVQYPFYPLSRQLPYYGGMAPPQRQPLSRQPDLSPKLESPHHAATDPENMLSPPSSALRTSSPPPSHYTTNPVARGGYEDKALPGTGGGGFIRGTESKDVSGSDREGSSTSLYPMRRSSSPFHSASIYGSPGLISRFQQTNEARRASAPHIPSPPIHPSSSSSAHPTRDPQQAGSQTSALLPSLSPTFSPPAQPYYPQQSILRPPRPADVYYLPQPHSHRRRLHRHTITTSSTTTPPPRASANSTPYLMSYDPVTPTEEEPENTLDDDDDDDDEKTGDKTEGKRDDKKDHNKDIAQDEEPGRSPPTVPPADSINTQGTSEPNQCDGAKGKERDEKKKEKP